MAGQTVPNDPVDLVSNDKVRQLRRQLWAAAKRAPGGINFRAVCVHRWGLTTSGRRGDGLTGAAVLERAGRVMLRADRLLAGLVRENRMYVLSGGVGSHTGLRTM
jgi:hypothetical protein